VRVVDKCAGEEVVGNGSAEDEAIILGGCGAAEVGVITADVEVGLLGDGIAEDEGIILGGCGVAEVDVITGDVEVRAQRKLLLEST
jgi:hypothetical protein